MSEPKSLPITHNDEPGSSSSQWAWATGGTPFPDLHTADPAGIREDSDPCSDMRVTASSTFYTPLSQNVNTAPSYTYDEAYYDTHSTVTSTNTATYQNSEVDGVDLAKVRREQSERCKQPSWPAALQKVVVGDVKDSLIAKRRRSTLKRRD